MRKRRAIIYDDDLVILNVLTMFFELRDYEVIACREPVPCPVYIARGRCTNEDPCGDIILTEYNLPKMKGTELLEAQARSGCKMASRNKAVMSGAFDSAALASVKRLGCAYFKKPVEFRDLEEWLSQCELRIDLTRSLGFRRRDARTDCCHDVLFSIENDFGLYDGTIMNWSDSGLCVRVARPPELYQTITLRTAVSIPAYRGMVRWTRESGDGNYLVGMSCD